MWLGAVARGSTQPSMERPQAVSLGKSPDLLPSMASAELVASSQHRKLGKFPSRIIRSQWPCIWEKLKHPLRMIFVQPERPYPLEGQHLWFVITPASEALFVFPTFIRWHTVYHILGMWHQNKWGSLPRHSLGGCSWHYTQTQDHATGDSESEEWDSVRTCEEMEASPIFVAVNLRRVALAVREWTGVVRNEYIPVHYQDLCSLVKWLAFGEQTYVRWGDHPGA